MAVFTHITKEDLKDFLKNYSFNNLDFIKGINEGIQNTNYKVGIDSNDYILTIYENITDTSDINFFLELMIHYHQIISNAQHQLRILKINQLVE